jgi:hypothetical protein
VGGLHGIVLTARRDASVMPIVFVDQLLQRLMLFLASDFLSSSQPVS